MKSSELLSSNMQGLFLKKNQQNNIFKFIVKLISSSNIWQKRGYCNYFLFYVYFLALKLIMKIVGYVLVNWIGFYWRIVFFFSFFFFSHVIVLFWWTDLSVLFFLFQSNDMILYFFLINCVKKSQTLTPKTNTVYLQFSLPQQLF